MRRAKIVATIGPASESEEALESLVKAGMNVARLNFSHGTHEQHQAKVAAIRAVSKKLGVPVGILQDLQGPKIRVGKLVAPLQLAVGEQVCLYSTQDEPPKTDMQLLPVDFREIFESVQKGDRLMLDDGRLALEVVSAEGRVVYASVLVGGSLSSHKGINLPGVKLRIAGFTEKDKKDLAFGISQGVDAVAISFVRSAEDVKTVRAAMEEFSKNEGKRVPLLIAKLEKPEAMNELEAILDIVDGVMVARGDLGVELPPERVPSIQKHIIRSANARAKLVITATQMLESMIQNPLPTRAEASDVANAIFDDTDAVMLSAETASGSYPTEAVAMMSRIIKEAEAHFGEWGSRHQDGNVGLGQSDAASMARATNVLAKDPEVRAVAVFTTQGRSAWLMSKSRPSRRILAFTPDQDTLNRLAFLWGVQPYLASYANTMDEMLSNVDATLLRTGIRTGQQVVVVCGYPVGSQCPPNMALLHTVGSDATISLVRKIAEGNVKKQI